MAEGHNPTQAPPWSVFKLCNHDELHEVMQQMTQDEVRRIYTNRARHISKFAEKARSDAFHIGFELAKESLSAASFHFMERVLTEMAQIDVVNKVFDRNTKRWTQSPMYTDSFIVPLPSPQFLCHMAKFVNKILEERSNSLTMKKVHETLRSPFLRIRR